MQWPEQLIVGGATRNSTSALRSAKALQTVVQLMGEREMYEYWADHYKVHHVGWTQEKAAAVLDSWQRKFAAVSFHYLNSKFILQHNGRLLIPTTPVISGQFKKDFFNDNLET